MVVDSSDDDEWLEESPQDTEVAEKVKAPVEEVVREHQKEAHPGSCKISKDSISNKDFWRRFSFPLPVQLCK